jgi:hypothetical protein
MPQAHRWPSALKGNASGARTVIKNTAASQRRAGVNAIGRILAQCHIGRNREDFTEHERVDLQPERALTGMDGSASIPRMARRAPWILLLVAAVFFGTLELHPVGEALHESLLAAGDPYSLTARHPGLPAHFEPSQQAQRPVCPVCLHQLRTNGAHLLPAALVTTPVSTGFYRPISTTLLRERCAAPRGARGPPLA